MVRVSSRIEKDAGCLTIKLTEAEKDLYTGAGWRVARFRSGQLVELFDPLDRVLPDEPHKAKSFMFQAVVTWMRKGDRNDEHLLVMCSSYELCMPMVVSMLDPGSLARMVEKFADALMQSA